MEEGFWGCWGIFDDLAGGVTDKVVSSADVLRFRQGILIRWADLEDDLEAVAFQLADNPGDDQKYVLLTLARRQLEHLPEILDLAGDCSLVGYSGVAGEPL